MPISGFVLAGGQSSRLGQDKALLPWNGATLLEHAVTRLRPVCRTVQICGDRLELKDRFPALTFLPDTRPGAGPLAAIVAALAVSETDWNLLLAVDLPLLPVEFLRALCARAFAESAARCILPLLHGRPQPLCALYHRSLAPALAHALVAGQHKITLALRQAECTIEPFDTQALAASLGQNAAAWLMNINTPEDWQAALSLNG